MSFQAAVVSHYLQSSHGLQSGHCSSSSCNRDIPGGQYCCNDSDIGVLFNLNHRLRAAAESSRKIPLRLCVALAIQAIARRGQVTAGPAAGLRVSKRDRNPPLHTHTPRVSSFPSFFQFPPVSSFTRFHQVLPGPHCTSLVDAMMPNHQSWWSVGGRRPLAGSNPGQSWRLPGWPIIFKTSEFSGLWNLTEPLAPRLALPPGTADNKNLTSYSDKSLDITEFTFGLG